MHQKKMGPLLLSGLMIGPILGSGIIILPPLVYKVAGSWAFLAWLLIVGTSFFFATIFGRLSILFPGSGGVANAIAHAFGERIKLLTSYYLIGAVLFGPVAVMLTAARYLELGSGYSLPVIGAVPLAICTGILLLQVRSIGRISLFISTLVAATLLSGAITVLLFHRKVCPDLPPFSSAEFGYGLLLLFWTVVGWEVVGNYSGDVHDPEKTIPRAVTFSVCIMALVSLSVAAAVQLISQELIAGRAITITDLIRPILGRWSDTGMAVLVSSLCITSYLLFTGGVARLIAFLADQGELPGFLAQKSPGKAPARSILFLAACHFLVLGGVYLGLTDVEQLVALANGFFIANALIGILAAIKLLESSVLRIAALLLSLLFTGILLQSARPVIAIIFCMGIYFLYRPRNISDKVDNG